MRELDNAIRTRKNSAKKGIGSMGSPDHRYHRYHSPTAKSYNALHVINTESWWILKHNTIQIIQHSYTVYHSLRLPPQQMCIAIHRKLNHEVFWRCLEGRWCHWDFIFCQGPWFPLSSLDLNKPAYDKTPVTQCKAPYISTISLHITVIRTSRTSLAAWMFWFALARDSAT